MSSNSNTSFNPELSAISSINCSRIEPNHLSNNGSSSYLQNSQTDTSIVIPETIKRVSNVFGFNPDSSFVSKRSTNEVVADIQIEQQIKTDVIEESSTGFEVLNGISIERYDNLKVCEMNNSRNKGYLPIHHIMYGTTEMWICKICTTVYTSSSSIYKHFKRYGKKEYSSNELKSINNIYQTDYVQMYVKCNISTKELSKTNKCITLPGKCKSKTAKVDKRDYRNNVILQPSIDEFKFDTVINKTYFISNTDSNQYQFKYKRNMTIDELNIIQKYNSVLNENEYIKQLKIRSKSSTLSIVVNSRIESLIDFSIKDNNKEIDCIVNEIEEDELEEQFNKVVEINNITPQQKSQIFQNQCKSGGEFDIKKYVYFISLCDEKEMEELFNAMIVNGEKFVFSQISMSKEDSRFVNQYHNELFKLLIDQKVYISYLSLKRKRKEDNEIDYQMIKHMAMNSCKLSFSIDSSSKQDKHYFGSICRIVGVDYVIDVPLFLRNIPVSGNNYGFKLCSKLMEEVELLKTNQYKISSATTDGESAMCGYISGFLAELEKLIVKDSEIPNILQSNHCYLHRISLIIGDLKTIRLFKVIYCFARTLSDETIRVQYHEFIQRLLEQEQDEKIKKTLKSLKKIPTMSDTRISYVSDILTTTLQQYQYVAHFVRRNPVFWKLYMKHMTTYDKKNDDGDESIVQSEVNLDQSNLLEELSFLDNQSVEEKEILQYLSNKFNGGCEFLNISTGSCDINCNAFKQTFVLNTYLSYLFHLICKWMQSKNILITEAYDLIDSLRRYLIASKDKDNTNIFNELFESKLFVELNSFVKIGSIDTYIVQSEHSINIEEFDNNYIKKLFIPIVDVTIMSINKRFRTLFHQISMNTKYNIQYDLKTLDIIHINRPTKELDRCKLEYIVELYKAPHRIFNGSAINVPIAMRNCFEDELRVMEQFIYLKGKELLQRKKSRQCALQKLLDTDNYLTVSDIIPYFNPNVIPGFIEIASVVNSIIPCSSLVEGMFSVASRKYHKNCTMETLETRTLSAMYRRMTMRIFI